MSTEASQAGHVPVLLEETVRTLVIDRDGSYVDGTFGRGGHARRLLDELSPKASLLVIDRDAEAIVAARRLADADSRVRVRQGLFSRMNEFVTQAQAGVMLDVGMSSPQIDDPNRGFSFLRDGPLDMRMDRNASPSAAGWLNAAPVAELARVFREYGGERHGVRIARAIAAARPVTTTAELAAIVADVVTSTEHKHVATRVFQATRIRVNDEIGELDRGLDAAFDVLRPGGRLAVITFHGLEHAMVRQRFRRWVRGAHEDTPRRLPIKGRASTVARLIIKGASPSEAEVRDNRRARSARLQVVEKTAERAA